jgi:hypothetical protein
LRAPPNSHQQRKDSRKARIALMSVIAKAFHSFFFYGSHLLVNVIWHFCGIFAAFLRHFCGIFAAFLRHFCGIFVALLWQGLFSTS